MSKSVLDETRTEVISATNCSFCVRKLEPLYLGVNKSVLDATSIYIYIYSYIPPAHWATGGLKVVSNKVTPLHTLSPGFRSGPFGSVAGKHRLLQTL